MSSLPYAAFSGDNATQKNRHDHNGVLKPYHGPPPVITLTSEEQKSLALGSPVYKSFDSEHGKQSVVVFRVNAPVNTIWRVIADFNSYPDWIENLTETTVYHRQEHNIFVRFRVHHWLAGDYTYFIHHYYPWQEHGWGTWKLDYSRPSDLDDSVGFWRVDAVPGDSNQSDVTYSTAIRFKGWMPGFMRKSAVKKGLKQATSWVKVEAEKLTRAHAR